MTTTTRAIWIGCLAAYNAGHLHGKWVDATEGLEAIEAARDEILRTSPVPGAEEWFIADTDGFGRGVIGEYSDLALVAEIAEAAEAAYDGDALIAYCELRDDPREALADFDEAYAGKWESFREYAESFAEDVGDLASVPEHMQFHIDWDSYARALETDYSTVQAPDYEVWVFRSYV